MDQPEVVSIGEDGFTLARLGWRHDVLHHADRHHRVELEGRPVIQVAADRGGDAGQLAPVDFRALRFRERDPVGCLHPVNGALVLEIGTPTAADIEHGGLFVHPREIRKDPQFLQLRLLERDLLSVEDAAGVIHPLVEPEAEEFVAHVVRNRDVGFAGPQIFS